jgi:XapX domain-containing protein
MDAPRMRRLKIVVGLLLAGAIGAACRLLGIPSPAPPVLAGAILVLSMSVGYVAVDRWCRTRERRDRDL